MNEFGTLIRDARHRTKTTLGELADELHLSVSHVSDVERGRRPPFPENLLPSVGLLLGLALHELQEAALLTEGVALKPTGPASQEFLLRLTQAWDGLTPDDFDRLVRALTPEKPTKPQAYIESHVQNLTDRDRDDRPIRPTCAHCGKPEALCTGTKP